MISDDVVVRDTRTWVERAVIGLNLCPFAKAVQAKGQVHYAVSHAGDAHQLLDDLNQELDALLSLAPALRDNTLLIVPGCLHDFLEFNDFLGRAERVLRKRHLGGVIQLASFHPDYRFESTEEGDIGNCTNRSPYPTLHLLREQSIDRAVQAFPEAQAIYEANIQKLRALGHEGWKALGVGRST